MIAPHNNINIGIFTFIKNTGSKERKFFTARIFSQIILVGQEEHCKEKQCDDPSACFYLFDFAGEKFDNNV